LQKHRIRTKIKKRTEAGLPTDILQKKLTNSNLVKNSILPGHFKRFFEGYIDDSVVVAGGEADLYVAIRGKDSVGITKDSDLFGGHLLETVLVPFKDRKL
jgi:hypothetical protein